MFFHHSKREGVFVQKPCKWTTEHFMTWKIDYVSNGFMLCARFCAKLSNLSILNAWHTHFIHFQGTVFEITENKPVLHIPNVDEINKWLN